MLPPLPPPLSLLSSTFSSLHDVANMEAVSIAAGMRQSGHAPNAVRLPDGGGWAPPESMTQRTGEEQEDVFTCFLSWMADEEGRNAWYKNLGNNMTVYDDIGRVMDELKILAEGGIESRTVTLQESF